MRGEFGFDLLFMPINKLARMQELIVHLVAQAVDRRACLLRPDRDDLVAVDWVWLRGPLATSAGSGGRMHTLETLSVPCVVQVEGVILLRSSCRVVVGTPAS